MSSSTQVAVLRKCHAPLLVEKFFISILTKKSFTFPPVFNQNAASTCTFRTRRMLLLNAILGLAVMHGSSAARSRSDAHLRWDTGSRDHTHTPTFKL